MERIQLRRDTSARWAEINPILLEGEVGYETDTKLRKIGDGVNRWNDLEYLRAEGIVQEKGNSENLTMSQDAITREFNELGSNLPTSGLVFDKVISAKEKSGIKIPLNLSIPNGTMYSFEVLENNNAQLYAVYFKDSNGVYYSFDTAGKSKTINSFDEDVNIIELGINTLGEDTIVEVKFRASIGAVSEIENIKTNIIPNSQALLPTSGLVFDKIENIKGLKFLNKSLNLSVSKGTKYSLEAIKNSSQTLIAMYFRDVEGNDYAYLLDDNKQKVGTFDKDVTLLSYGINTSGEGVIDAELRFSIGAVADIKAINEVMPNIKDSIKKNTDVIIKFNKELESNFLSDSNSLQGYYIATDGKPNPTSLNGAKITEMIQVKTKEVWHYRGSWSESVGLGYVWGYSDENYNNKQIIVPCVKSYNDSFEIPNNVNYIMAWGVYDSELYKVDSFVRTLEKVEDNSFNRKRLSHNLLNVKNITEGYYVSYKDGMLINLDTYSVSDYIPIISKSKYIQNHQQQVAFYDKNKVFISGLQVLNNVPYESPEGAAFLRICFPTQYKEDIRVNQGEYIVDDVYQEGFEDFFVKKDNIVENEIVIVAKRNEQDYNSIRELMSTLPASASQRYIIYIPKGRWFESDIIGHPYIKLIGEDRENTVLYCDGASQKITPEDYSFSNYKGLPLSEVPNIYKHCINVRKDIYLENLTVECSNGKYCVHLDSDGRRHGIFKNCIFTAKENMNFPLGFGVWANQHFEFHSCCVNAYVHGSYCMYIHNWNNQKAICSVKFKYCYFNGNYATIGELGSEYSMLLDFNHCISSNNAPEFKIYVERRDNGESFWLDENGNRVSDLELVPYSIKLNYIGTDVANINSVNRPNILNYLIGKIKR